MSEQVDNPPAFPVPDHTITRRMNENSQPYDDTVHGSQGMSLRDWFAGQALAVMLANQTYLENLRQEAKLRKVPVVDAIASACGETADAMLRERGKGVGR